MICCEQLSVLKKYNVKRHYESKHSSKFDNMQGQLRKDMVDQLQETQRNLFVSDSSIANTVRASYLVSQILAKKDETIL